MSALEIADIIGIISFALSGFLINSFLFKYSEHNGTLKG
jgi:hypothetical protein